MDPTVKDDLILLDSYRRSFSETYETVVRAIRDRLGLEVSGRPAKSTNSIIEKLKRESIRLTQMQDIAGCRLVVSDCIAQEQVVADLVAIFSGATVIDRREKSSFGYRAVHVVVANAGKLVELQVRTRLQHMRAEISEKYADLFGSEIKYGGGEGHIRDLLKQRSELLARYERLELDIIKLKDSDMTANMRKDLAEVKEDLLKSLEEEGIKLRSEESDQ